jgi:hypothetical protein
MHVELCNVDHQTIDDLAKENKLDVMPGAFLHDLWKYSQRVRSNLSLDLKESETSDALTTLGDSSCISLTDSDTIPSWFGFAPPRHLAQLVAYASVSSTRSQAPRRWESACQRGVEIYCGPSWEWRQHKLHNPRQLVIPRRVSRLSLGSTAW